MNITVNARHMEVTDSIRDYAHDKTQNLDRYFDRIQTVEVIMDIEGGSPVAEIVVSVARSNRFVARHRGEDMYGCIDKAVHKIEEQLRRHKDKVRDRKGLSHEAQLEQATKPQTTEETEE